MNEASRRRQVCNLDLSCRLKDAGVKQESHFWWSDDISLDGITWGVTDCPNLYPSRTYISAFTLTELGALLLPLLGLSQLQFLAAAAVRGGYLFDPDFWAMYLVALTER